MTVRRPGFAPGRHPVSDEAINPMDGAAMGMALELLGVSKTFDGFQALAKADFAVETGEVHALLGENGAGKSTLMNVAAGLYRPDQGRIRVRGREVELSGPVAARHLGIGMVYQHYKLVKAFNAVENILLAQGAPRYGTGLAEVEAAIRAQSEAVGFAVDLRRPVGSLSVAEQQRVEILKVLVAGAGILILDEPTAVLTDREAEALLTTMQALARQGAAVILVTHKLGEVQRHADRVTVMRGGRIVASADPASLTAAELTTLVVGATANPVHCPATRIEGPVLAVEDLAGTRSDGLQTLHGLNLTIRAGEIYGIAGVGGNGQTELAEILMGVRRAGAGRIALAGDDVTGTGPKLRRARGLAAIPADRQVYGLAGDLSVAENYAVGGLTSGRFGGWLRVDRAAIRAGTEAAIAAFDIRGARSPRQKASLLSGGNAQKLVIAREFAGRPRFVLAHSPARGLDVRATADIHRRLREARDAGAGVLLISEDLDEVMLMSDRIGVMSRGRIVGEFDAPADRQAIGVAMVHHA
ncbi:ABC transporter ATP-binding protein [Methylobacterium sp. Leaf117]|uniref:ABC transporter ATP-binding protein n=1 Tax=Methylobacterium sp. Leaf117 TaxID=1736260 RepID=UPI000A61EA77|nr:ABC transporter ATP-binding protein [Methylobacterium sp. Leaf117]